MNDRGQYGRRMHRPDYHDARMFGHDAVAVGFVRTPGEIEDELDQLENEVAGFEKQLLAQVRRAKEQATSKDAELRRVENELNTLEPTMGRIRGFADKIVRLQERMPHTAIELRDAILEFEKFMPVTKRREVIDRYTKAAGKRDELLAKSLGDSPLFNFESAWKSFRKGWSDFYQHKKYVPAQTWPGSGTWDRIQEYRKQFVELHGKAPFQTTGPTPLSPEGRKDPGLLEGAGDALKSMGSILKWTLIGVLGIGGVVAVSSVIANVRKGRDPIEHYSDVYKGLRRRGAS